jgi:uncharacterized protein (DUF2062 family)
MLGTSRIRGWLDQLLHTHDTPHRTATAYALGVFLGFSPFLGLHAVMGLALAFALGLNRVAVILGVYSNLPWFVPAYYTVATLGGAALLGVDVQRAALEEAMSALGSLSWRELRSLGRTLAPFMWAYMVGSTVGAVLLSGIAYRVSLAMILAHRHRASQVDRTPGQM